MDQTLLAGAALTLLILPAAFFCKWLDGWFEERRERKAREAKLEWIGFENHRGKS